eukprot:TRINITY_DN202_c0_g1_i1.p1 TRINITY_DN202_c0_g1~~TRINITY_DN202_c0_g1_i1.p1  ORF type:complete len:334 (-),score=92.71 TRINITY_DN202_c0_g1_i1:41-1042(-)
MESFFSRNSPLSKSTPSMKYTQINIPDVTEVSTLQEAEHLVKHNWSSLLHTYQHMPAEELEECIIQANRNVKVNCLRKGENLIEPAALMNAYGLPPGSPSSANFKRGALRRSSTGTPPASPLINNPKPPQMDLMDMDIPTTTKLPSNPPSPTLSNTSSSSFDFPQSEAVQNVIITLADGSREADRALEKAYSMIINPVQEHLIIVVPWNSHLPAGIINALSANSLKYHITSNNCNLLLKNLLWEQARNVALRYEEALTNARPEIDYTLLIAPGNDPCGTTASIAQKYCANFVVVGKKGFEDHLSERKITPYFGSNSFIQSLQKAMGKTVVLVV